jgi:hypothetical protein
VTETRRMEKVDPAQTRRTQKANATVQMGRLDPAKLARWFYRTPKGDFGPVTTDKLMEAMGKREIDLSTLVCKVGTTHWGPAGEVDLLRAHHAACKVEWDHHALASETDRMARSAERAHVARKSTSVGLVIGLVALVVFGGGMWWRLSRAEALGFERLVKPLDAQPLPAWSAGARPELAAPEREPVKVPRLAEPETLDTAGVRVGDSSAPIVTRLDFDESGEAGEASALDPGELDRIVGAARGGLIGCAQQLAQANDGFTGTEVRFTVSPGRLVDFVVGKEVAGSQTFRACVKRVLAGVKVPNFQGNPRSVTVPLRVGG